MTTSQHTGDTIPNYVHYFVDYIIIIITLRLKDFEGRDFSKEKM